MIEWSGDHGGPPVAVVLHERRNRWARQLRPRLRDLPIRWFETRSASDLAEALRGRASPIVVIDLGDVPDGALEDLARVVTLETSARTLVLDSEARDGVGELARDLGATLVVSGFVPPPEVARVIARWAALASAEIDQGGWSRPFPVDPARQPAAWIDGLVREADAASALAVQREPPSEDS